MYEPHRLGREGETFFCFLSQRMGWQLARPDAVEASYDLAIKRQKDRKWRQVQIKVSAPKRTGSGSSVDIRRTGNKSYKRTDYDLLGVYDPATLRAWLIPYDKLSHVACEFTPSKPEFDKYEVHY